VGPNRQAGLEGSAFEKSKGLRMKPIAKTCKMQSTRAYREVLLTIQVVVILALTCSVRASRSGLPKVKFDDIIQQFSSRDRIRHALTQSTPALRPLMNQRLESSQNNNRDDRLIHGRRHALSKDASVRTVSSISTDKGRTKARIRGLLKFVGSTGFYYGIDAQTMISSGGPRKPRPPKLEDSLITAIEELKLMRQEMEQMRLEMQQLKRKMLGDDDSSFQIDDYASSETKEKALRKRQKEADKLAAEIESWAETLLTEGEEDGWSPVECSKMIRASVNGMERTTAFIKWMVDPRGEKADREDNVKHPCIKCDSIIDAPLELVCTYLSQREVFPNYNDVVEKYEDLEEISPHAKICWSSSPQILFVKPRDFVTFCHHRWKPDGSQVIVNQACEHPKFPLEKMEKEGKSCRGYALRGANFISRCSEDPMKTKITIVAHCRPGGGLPEWATKTAVKTLAPLEPFKLFHKINEQVLRNKDQIQERLNDAEERGTTMPPGRSWRPGGFAQIGYACFWPNGGGKEERSDINDFSPMDSEDGIQKEMDGLAVADMSR